MKVGYRLTNLGVITAVEDDRVKVAPFDGHRKFWISAKRVEDFMTGGRL